MIEGTVESIDVHGIFHGWLRDTRDPLPALVQIRLNGQPVAEALAGAFRRDLLRTGHGHGHYGFLARARAPLPIGLTRFELFLPRHDQGIPVRLPVPAIAAPGLARVEQLLQRERAWTVADLTGAVRCLDLAAQRDAMGTPRFVDVTFQFVLTRWPLPEEAAVYAQAIEEGSTTPDAFLEELLASHERKDLGSALASPWDAAFPFMPTPAKERV